MDGRRWLLSSVALLWGCEADTAVQPPLPTEPEGPRYDLVLDWLPGRPLPEGRERGATAVVGGVLYVAGGAQIRVEDYPIPSHNPIPFYRRDVFRLDSPVDAWARVAPLPELPADGLRLAGNGRRLYAALGRRIWAYDPGTDVWSELTALPAVRSASTLMAIQDRLYVVGGAGPTLIFDLGREQWQEGAPVPEERTSPVLVEAGGRILALGGEVYNALESRFLPARDIVAYDPAIDAWMTVQTVPADLTVTVFRHGGLGPSGTAVHLLSEDARTQAILDLDTGVWTRVQPLRLTRTSTAVAVWDGRVLSIGGWIDRGANVPSPSLATVEWAVLPR
ncbi:MAG: hypothetical protein R3E10_06610 [Gemmatimonadota bacterium]